jgi:hypothetical protein
MTACWIRGGVPVFGAEMRFEKILMAHAPRFPPHIDATCAWQVTGSFVWYGMPVIMGPVSFVLLLL